MVNTTSPPMVSASSRGFPYRSHPTGWFHVGWSAEFVAGEVVPLRYFSRDLVAFRGESGMLSIMDAHCPHLGAHMGYGGSVCGDELVCPFHGWQWNAEGHNTRIPYSSRPNRGQRVTVWPVHEVNGLVMLWYDATGAEPTWELPLIPGYDTDTFYPVHPHCTGEWLNRPVAPQFLGENLADPAHQKYVHEATDVPEIVEFSGEGPLWHSRQRMVWGRGKGDTWLTPSGGKVGHLDIQGWGIGIALFRFEGIDDTVQIQAITPVDDTVSDLRMTNFVPRHEPDAVVPTERAARRIEHLRRQVGRDLVVWEHMTYIARPPLPPEEAKPYLAYRRWADQFYPEPATPAVSAATGRP